MQDMAVDNARAKNDDRLVLLGQAIREAVATADTTQQALADQLGIDNAGVSRLIGGKVKNVSLEQIRKIEDILGRRRGELLVLAGYVELPGNTKDYIAADPGLSDTRRRVVAENYDFNVRSSSAERREGRRGRR